MFPIMTFCLLLGFSAAWMIFAAVYWEKIPSRVAGVLLAVTLAVLGFSLNTPDCQTWSCEAPPETMTAPQWQLDRQRRASKDKNPNKDKAPWERRQTTGDAVRMTKRLGAITAHTECMVEQRGNCHLILEAVE